MEYSAIALIDPSKYIYHLYYVYIYINSHISKGKYYIQIPYIIICTYYLFRNYSFGNKLTTQYILYINLKLITILCVHTMSIVKLRVRVCVFTYIIIIIIIYTIVNRVSICYSEFRSPDHISLKFAHSTRTVPTLL